MAFPTKDCNFNTLLVEDLVDANWCTTLAISFFAIPLIKYHSDVSYFLLFLHFVLFIFPQPSLCTTVRVTPKPTVSTVNIQ